MRWQTPTHRAFQGVPDTLILGALAAKKAGGMQMVSCCYLGFRPCAGAPNVVACELSIDCQVKGWTQRAPWQGWYCCALRSSPEERTAEELLTGLACLGAGSGGQSNEPVPRSHCKAHALHPEEQSCSAAAQPLRQPGEPPNPHSELKSLKHFDPSCTSHHRVLQPLTVHLPCMSPEALNTLHAIYYGTC